MIQMSPEILEVREIEELLEEHAAWMSVLRPRDDERFRLNFLSDRTGLELWLVGKLPGYSTMGS